MNQYTKGVIFGSLVGAGYALLHAPASGKDTRLAIKTYFSDLKANKNQVKNDLNRLEKSITTLQTDGVTSALNFSKELATSVDTFQKNAQPSIDKIKLLVNNLQNHLTDITEN